MTRAEFGGYLAGLLDKPATVPLVRNALVYKGRSRDTDWFSITDTEWPALRADYATWLDPANFDAGGRQVATLEQIRASPRGDCLR